MLPRVEPTTAPAAAGRPRGAQAGSRILTTARALFSEQGYSAVTMAAIAGAAGVGLDTIYRRWPSKQALLVDLMASAVAEDAAVPDTGDVTRDLRDLLSATMQTFGRSDLGPLMAAAISEAAREPTLAATISRSHAQRRASSRVIIDRALERGQVRPGFDADLLLDLLSGIIWQRVFVAHQLLTDEEIRETVELLIGPIRVEMADKRALRSR